jgi:hypothetical protein
MAQFETTGGGYIDSGDRKVIRKVVVATDGELINVPQTADGYPLSNVSVSQDAGGVRRAVLEYSQGGEGGASYNAYGKRIELTGGTREVPIYNHPYFSTLTPAAIQEVQTAADAKTPLPTPTTPTQQKLYGFLVRGIEYFLSPAVVGRVTEIESVLPSLQGIAKVANPPELTEQTGTFWVCTAITASPIGNRYEVTREYTLNYSSWSDVEFLYNNWEPDYSEE